MDFYNFRCAYEIVDDKTYSVVIIHTREGSEETNVYAVHKQTGGIYYTNYERLYSKLLLNVPHDESDDTDKFLSEINECIDRRNNIPDGLPISFDITKQNSHIEILVHYQKQYDFHKINWEGIHCHREIGEQQKPNESIEADKRCDNRPLSTHYGYGAFRCAYNIWMTVYDNEDYVVLYISGGGTDAYIINKSTNKVVFYDFKDKFNGEKIFERYKQLDATIATKICSDKRLQFPEHMLVKFEMVPKNGTTEIFVSYDNKFDYFEINWNGTVRQFEQRLEEVPIEQSAELPEQTDVEFKCPYDIIDDRDYTILVINNVYFKGRYRLYGAYVYFRNKESFEVLFKYFPSYLSHRLSVPQSKKDENIAFDSQIDSCVALKNLIPAAMNASISRINNHIRITVGYGGKYDYYEINYKGRACHTVLGLAGPINRTTEDAMRQCEHRNIIHPSSTNNHSFSCALKILNPANDHYAALVIQLENYGESNAYTVNKVTSEADFKQFTDFSGEIILVKQTESDENPVYVAEFDECLNLNNAIPSDIPLKFSVTKVNHHLNILVYDDGHYDHYEFNARGEACFTAVRQGINTTRTLEEQMECDRRELKRSLKPYAANFQPQFGCGYEVNKNKTNVVILVHSTDGVYEYIVDRSTGKTELYLYKRFWESYVEQQTKCLNRKYASDIPLEHVLKVTMKPKNLDTHENYLEILVKYQGKYDLYVAEESGYVRYMELQLSYRPKHSIADYAKKIQCKQSLVFRFLQKTFRCPFKVVEDANYVNISVNAFHYEHVYVIDKSNNAAIPTKYFKVPDNLILSNLPIPDAELNYIADVDECVSSLLNLTSPFPVDVVRNKNFLQICNDPAFVFKCPSVSIEEDERQVTLKVTIFGDAIVYHTYTLLKSSGDVSYKWSAVKPATNFPNVLKSLIG